MSDPKFKDKFVAFVDILGFKNMVAASEKGNGFTLAQLLAVLKLLVLQRIDRISSEKGREYALDRRTSIAIWISRSFRFRIALWYLPKFRPPELSTYWSTAGELLSGCSRKAFYVAAT